MIDRDVVDRLLMPQDVLPAVREAFELHSAREGRVFPVVREKLAGGGIFGIKAGDVAAQGLLGLKVAGFWPSNRALGGETHQATVLLIDPTTGRPQCIIDGNAITTARTAAAGTLGLERLARPDSGRITVFGTGVQAKAQLRFALDALKNVKSVGYVSADRQRDAAFETQFCSDIELQCVKDPDEAVRHSDVVITATPGAGPLFDVQAVQPGTHINSVGADTKGKRELPQGLIQMARVVVDDEGQSREIGELQWAPDAPCMELGDLLAGKIEFARDPEDITLFDLTGLALQDLTVARLLYQRAAAQGLGASIAWPW